MNIKEEIKKLSRAEKILLVEEIWDDIAAEHEDDLTEAQKTELRRRSKLVEENKVVYLTVEESLARLKPRSKDV